MLLQGFECMKDVIWFWNASKKYTRYTYSKLFFLWWKPLFKFMRLTREDREQFKRNSEKFISI